MRLRRLIAIIGNNNLDMCNGNESDNRNARTNRHRRIKEISDIKDFYYPRWTAYWRSTTSVTANLK